MAEAKMASPPSCSSASPTLPELETFSDDSGVDVKSRDNAAVVASTCENRRNKRKSSEPKKRKDVLLMKRFRWDTDEEDIQGTDDVFERPSSGDSGCRLEEEEEKSSEKKKRCWRRQQHKEGAEEAFRQSVICKNECTGSSAVAPESQDSDSLKDYEPEDGPLRSRSSGRPRNYKSMSRQRRIEANARERTRVHTISAAFESLRRAVPAYAHNQKLSKLAILRIASAYIVALACLNGDPGAERPPSMAECVEQCTRTIQAEGRSRRRTFKD